MNQHGNVEPLPLRGERGRDEGVSVFSQPLAELVELALRLEYKPRPGPRPGRALENPGDGLAAHPGADDRAALFRAGEAEAVGELEAYPVLEPGFGGVAARARQRARADVGGYGAGYGAALDEAYGQVAVVRTHVTERIRPGGEPGAEGEPRRK